MDNTAEGQSKVNGAGPVAVPQAETAHVVLERLARWKAVIDPRLQAQMTLLEVLEEYLLVELRTRYQEGNIDPHFIGTLMDTVLQRMIDDKPLEPDQEYDVAFRWPGGPDRGVAAERQEVIVQVVESVAWGGIQHYKDYLRRYWRMTTGDVSLEGLVQQKLNEHMAAIDRIFQSDQLVGLDVDELRERIEKLQDGWGRMSEATALATAQERRDLDALARLQLLHWLRVLDEPGRASLQLLQERTLQAQALVDELLDGLGSLRAFARQQAKAYVRHELDMAVEPDSVRVTLQWKTVVDQPIQRHSLSDLLVAGPVRSDAVSVLLVENGAMLRNQPLSSAFISRLLADVDAPAGYLQALADRYDRTDLKRAMFDWLAARLQQSAFIARCAGHLKAANHDAVKALWGEGEPSVRRARLLHVTGLVLPNGLRCADLLLFFREDMQGDLLLYAPAKPDGQEWIELPSLWAVSVEIGTWTRNEAGREYLAQQLSPDDRETAREYFAHVVDKPVSWDSGKDLRAGGTGFRACLENIVAMGLAHNLAQVQLDESPRWYSALPLDSRRNISSLSQELLVHQRAFNEQLADFEVFVDFAKRTVAKAITPYLRRRGVLEPVDPATILIDYSPGLAGRDTKTASLLDLVIHGYDDNSGIDDPRKGVRSSVGQDLRQVRSAELALYIRRAYVGERYGKETRAKFLDVDSPAYIKRRNTYRHMLLIRIDRDLRVAKGKGLLNDSEFWWLTRQVTLLGESVPVFGSEYPGTVVRREGVVRFTVDGHVVLGVYVFTYFDPKRSSWLYTPDAPDGVTFRRYRDFSGGVAARLHDYVVGRVALTAREKVRRSLVALATASARVDALRELNRVIDIRAEFDAYIERSVTDVEDVTTSRTEMIEGQVIKGLLFASAPVCMVYPPFVLLLDIALITVSSGQAIEAHVQGDTESALWHWMFAAWGALFALFGPQIMGAVRHLWHVVKPVSLSAQRLRYAALVATKESDLTLRPIRFKAHQAIKRVPENLVEVTEEGIFKGTWRSPSSASQPRDIHFIKHKGRYYQVKTHPSFNGLRLVDARNPGALYQEPLRRMSNGKWIYDKPGLLGGNGEVSYLGRVDDLRAAFPGHVFPDVSRGALQGEAVVARFSEAVADNYLFSLNAQTCVIASLHNPTTGMGAVIHFDHNIRALIERCLRDITQRLGGVAQDIRATLVGGDWLTGTDIGGRVRSAMRRQGLQPTWDYWSYSSCFGSTYGVALDLRSGVTSVFKTSRGQVERYYIPVLARAKKSADPVSVRARGFMRRVRNEPLVANPSGAISTGQGRPVTSAQIEAQAFSTVLLS
ncbi:dermonecrotic toxin domain-containing protein [Pseudomonas mediterranea]|uniref:dermonecrotic toxin domain-containing protein n=1 Tax=Pseudomonas mediterranea TaxID=183795 RepID=UPI003BF4FB40